VAFLRAQAKTDSPNADFSYLPADTLYFDSACQTLRPQQVIDAMDEYYHEYNACGERVKYEWGRKVDEKVERTRESLLKLAGKSGRDYVCAFTLNTTYGLNLVLSQLPHGAYKNLVTSEIEHNSVFLPTITWAKKLGLKRTVLARQNDGSISYTKNDLDKSVVVVNTTSNVNGANLANARELVRDAHVTGGIVIFDGAQTMGHNAEILKGVDYDAICFSGHKMYGPSLGVIIIKKELLNILSFDFIGGGMVQDVQLDSYTLLPDEPHTRLEAGLQNFAGIIGLGAAIDWQKNYRPEGQPAKEYELALGQKLFDGLSQIPSLKIFNQSPVSIVSFYSPKIDAHQLAIYLSAQDIMARSGYFCCHYYLSAKLNLPPLLRLSLGLNNTEDQVDKLIEILQKIIGSR